MSFVVRTAVADPAGLMATIRKEIGSIDAALPLTDVTTMKEMAHGSLSQPRFLSGLISLFACLAALLALVGVNGLMAYTISRQRHEFGIRLAMGASPGTLLRMIVARGGALAGIGIALGVLGAIALTRVMASMLYQVTPTDPGVIIAACSAILAAALAACFAPARTAACVNPIETLRTP
jgi:putative ABC transport system permease protein